MREAAAELDHLEPARHLAHRVGEHLAVLGGQELRDLLALLVEELADREEELGALRERERAPGGERLPSPPGPRGRPLRPSRGRRRPTARRSPGCTPARCARTGRRSAPPEIQWLMGLTAAGRRRRRSWGPPRMSAWKRSAVASADGADTRTSSPRTPAPTCSPRPSFETCRRDGYVYIAGPHNARARVRSRVASRGRVGARGVATARASSSSSGGSAGRRRRSTRATQPARARARRRTTSRCSRG